MQCTSGTLLSSLQMFGTALKAIIPVLLLIQVSQVFFIHLWHFKELYNIHSFCEKEILVPSLYIKAVLQKWMVDIQLDSIVGKCLCLMLLLSEVHNMTEVTKGMKLVVSRVGYTDWSVYYDLPCTQKHARSLKKHSYNRSLLCLAPTQLHRTYPYKSGPNS